MFPSMIRDIIQNALRELTLWEMNKRFGVVIERKLLYNRNVKEREKHFVTSLSVRALD